jgi:hypothetical protein
MSLAKVGVFEAGSAAIETPGKTTKIESATAPLAEIHPILFLNPISIVVASLLRRVPVER